jgi:hypothetical protein
MYAFIPGVSKVFARRDMRADRVLEPIRPIGATIEKTNTVAAVCVLDGFRDCIAVLGPGFEFFDLRESVSVPTHRPEMVGEPFALGFRDPANAEFLIANRGPPGEVVRMDLRKPEVAKTVPVSAYQAENSPGKVFAWHPKSLTAMAYDSGVSLIATTGRQLELPVKKLGVSSMVFHRTEPKLAYLNGEVYIEVVDIYDTEKRR